MEDKLMKIKTAAEILDCHRRTIERMIAAGKLKVVTLPIGGRRLLESQIEALCKQGR